jgi:hypothetical protein
MACSVLIGAGAAELAVVVAAKATVAQPKRIANAGISFFIIKRPIERVTDGLILFLSAMVADVFNVLRNLWMQILAMKENARDCAQFQWGNANFLDPGFFRPSARRYQC